MNQIKPLFCRLCKYQQSHSSELSWPPVLDEVPKIWPLDQSTGSLATVTPWLCWITKYLLFFEEFHLLVVTHEPMFRHKIVFEHIEQQLLLFEQLKSVWRLFLFGFLAYISKVSGSLSIQNSSTILFSLRWSNNKEVIQLLTTLMNSVQIFSR